MLKLPMFTLLCASAAAAQTQVIVIPPARPIANPFGGLVDAFRLGSEIRTNRALEDLLNAQAEAVRLQSERIQQQNKSSALSQKLDREFLPAVEEVKRRYPDFETYRVEAARIMGDLDPRSPQFNLEHYIEGMYLIAKSASFSGLAAPPKESSVVGIMKDPEFHKLPIATRIRLARDVEPALLQYKDDDLEIVIMAIAAKLSQ